MMNGLTKTLLFSFLLITSSYTLNATCTPLTVSMASGDNNLTAFTADGQIGVDGAATYYVHWDNTYLYLGWSGGSTNYSSDMYYAAIDVDPGSGNGSAAAIEGVSFDVGVMDYYVVYENNASFYGLPASNGNAFEVYSNSAGSWNFSSRTGGDDGMSSQINFDGTNGEVRLRIAWADLGGFTPGVASDLRISMWTNNNSGNFAWSSLPSANPTGGTPQVLTDGFTFSSTAAGTCPAAAASNATLPVDFSQFSAKLDATEVDLTWTTAMELDNSHFELERSQDLRNWEVIALVDGKGTSFESTNYNHTDNKPNQGANYYRIKQIDFNGNMAYSKTLLIEFSIGEILVFPNPVREVLTISLAQKSAGTLIVYNLQGQLILSEAIDNAQKVELDLAALQTGIYLLSISDANGFVVDRRSIVKE